MAAEFRREAALRRGAIRRGQQLSFWVAESEGHDDVVVSAARREAAAGAG